MNEKQYANLSALVIDDQAFVRRVVTGVLRQIGFGLVMDAEDGASGLEVAQKMRPDIIFCDIEMEPIDGLVFLETLRKAHDSGFTDARVIFLTQHSESDIVAKAKALGVNAFIVKPPSLQAIKDRIDHVLQERK